MPIRVILADDHPVVRDGLRAVIEHRCRDIKVTGEAGDGREVLALAEAHPADVYVLDISMPELNGIEAAARLLERDRRAKVIILSIHDSRAFVEKALHSGARGYVLKESATEEVIHAIREVHAGQYYLSPAISKHVVDGFLSNTHRATAARPEADLTTREREVLQLIAEGLTSKDIAVKLDLAVNTVHVHRTNIMRKLDIHTQAELIRYALREGISKL